MNGWKKSFYGRVESVLSRAQLLSNYFHLKSDANYLATDLGRYTAINADSVFKASSHYLKKNHVRIDVIPVEAAPKAKSDASKTPAEGVQK